MRGFLFVVIFTLSSVASAQMWDALATSEYKIDSSEVKTLNIEIDNISFFRDNEYTSVLTKGYSLPGLWVQPKLTYVPLPQIKLELGLHALIFNGANKYPCFAYHDISTWKGNQYQSGAHLLPWFRAKAQLKHLTVVLGNIYGGQNHRLTEPMMNPEINLSQDPEMGFQLLWDRPHLHADTWLNWQSYIFNLDTHQEAFTVGSNWIINYNKLNQNLVWFSPIQLVAQHRGGEQDITNAGVKTLYNVSIGEGVKWRADKKALKQLTAEADFLACYQQTGELWPFKSGMAINANTSMNLWEKLNVNIGYFYAPKSFCSLYGNHFFSTKSTIDDKDTEKIQTLYSRIDYHYTFSKYYVLGADVEAFQSWIKTGQEFNFSFGIYMRVSPRFTLKRWKE